MQHNAYSLREKEATAWAHGSPSRAPAATRAGELLRLLAGHPQLEIGAVTAGSSTGKPVTSIHPNLTGHPAFDGKNFQLDRRGDPSATRS